MFLRIKVGLRRILCFLIVFLGVTSAFAQNSEKAIRMAIAASETGFDPIAAHDLYSAQIISGIFDTLYTYDYLARPVKLIPQAAESMPEISEDGKTWTIRIKKGIYFADDTAFQNKKRELTAEDFAYSLKRLIDPNLRSPWTWLLDGKIVGAKHLVREAKKNGFFDYDKKIIGLEVSDRYTLHIHLNEPDYNFGQILAHTPTSAVAREVIEKYRDANGYAMANPVGTGAYVLANWTRGAKIVLTKNPNYRGFVWNFAPQEDADKKIVEQMKGKPMPQIMRVEINVIPEDQSRWLAFQNKEIDIFGLEGPLAPRALENGKLKDEWAKKGIKLSRLIEPELSQYYFNMQDPILGGLTKEKIALRRAIAMAHNIDEEIAVIWNGQAVKLNFPIPPGVLGHDKNYKSSVIFDPVTANALLDKFDYRKGSDGWRNLPTGKPFSVKFSAVANSTGQQQAEMWKKTFDSLSIRMETDKRPFPDLLKAEKQCRLMMRTSPWIADYPDGDNFMQLFYGGNIGQSNNGCVKMAEFDRLYEESKKLPDGEERNMLYRKMARLLEFYAPTLIGYARYRNMLIQPHVIGYKKHPIMHNEWMYIDVDNK